MAEAQSKGVYLEAGGVRVIQVLFRILIRILKAKRQHSKIIAVVKGGVVRFTFEIFLLYSLAMVHDWASFSTSLYLICEMAIKEPL